jgi:hypothetical protein
MARAFLCESLFVVGRAAHPERPRRDGQQLDVID